MILISHAAVARENATEPTQLLTRGCNLRSSSTTAFQGHKDNPGHIHEGGQPKQHGLRANAKDTLFYQRNVLERECICKTIQTDKGLKNAKLLKATLNVSANMTQLPETTG